MKKRSTHHIPLLGLTGNLIILNLCFVVGFMLKYDFFYRTYSEQNLVLYLYLNLTWVLLSIISGSLRERSKLILWKLLVSDFLSLTFFFIFFLLFFQVFEIGYYFQRDELKIVFALFAALLFLWKILLHYGYLALKRARKTLSEAIIVGYGTQAVELRRLFENDKSTGVSFLGYFDHRESDDPRYLGDYDALLGYIQQHPIDEIYFSMTEIPEAYHDKISLIINTIPLNIRFIPNLAGFSYLNTELVNYDMVPIIEVHQGPLSRFYNRWLKRLFDMALSVFVILFILSWMTPLLYIIKKISGETGLFFIQHRSGLNNKRFRCIKFQTMRENQEADTRQVVKNDPRITRLGKVLRKTNIDELPQFINVFMNQMSVVGPRPHMLAHTDQYKHLANKFMVRQMIKPGITGLAQVRGFRGEIRSQEDLVMRIQFDLTYIEKWTFWMDAKIIFLTILNMVKGDQNAY